MTITKSRPSQKTRSSVTSVVHENTSIKPIPSIEQPSDFQHIYYSPAQGNRGGDTYTLRRPNQKVKVLELWSAKKDRLRGVKVTFDDDTVMQAGTLTDHHKSIHFQPNEMITSSTIGASDYRGGRAGFVELVTNFGQKYLGVYRHGEPHYDSTQGSLIGVHGDDGADLDSIGLILALPEDTAYHYINVRYDLSGFQGAGDKMTSLEGTIVENDSQTASLEADISFTHSHTHSRSLSNNASWKLGAKVTVEGGVPFVAGGKLEVSGEVGHGHTWGHGRSEQRTETWTMKVSVPPKSKVQGLAVVTVSTIDVPYTADVIIKRDDGSSETIREISGVFHDVSTSNFDAKLKDI